MKNNLKIFSQKIFPNISVITSLYNEEENIERLWNQLLRLDKYLNIDQFVMVDNGSKDNTLKCLRCLSDLDKRVLICKNEYPSSYSNGFSTGIKFSTSEYTLITHSDCQYSIDSTIQNWLENLYYSGYIILDTNYIAFSKRLNRNFFSSLISFTNNFLNSKFKLKGKYIDFNSSPKIIPTKFLLNFYENEGFIFDIALISFLFENKNQFNFNILPIIPVIYNERTFGKSSWKKNLFGYIKIIIQYLAFLIKNKRK